MNGVKVKPSKEVKVNEIYIVKIGILEKTVKVISVPKSRVGAQLVSLYYADMTPAEEYERVKTAKVKFEYRNQGMGRPTKRERRQIEYLKDFCAEES